MRLTTASTDYEYAILDHSAQTQQWYNQKLSVFVEWCAEHDITTLEALTQRHIRAFLADLHERVNWQAGKPLSSYTIHGYAQVLKGFLNWCHREDLISDRLTKRMDMPRVDVKVIEIFTPEQMKALLHAAKTHPHPFLAARDRAILTVLFDTGLRASELCGLPLDAVHLTPQDAFLKVLGKGRKEREVGLGNEARSALNRYIIRYRKAPPDEKHVFVTLYREPLERDALARIFYRLRDAARITGVRCSPHTARHTFAVNYLQAGGDIYKLSRLLGHNSVQTTETYLRAFKARDARKDGPSVLDVVIGQ